MGVPLSDLIDPDAEARIRAAVGGDTKAAAPAEPELVEEPGGDFEVKELEPTGEMEHKADSLTAGGAQVLESDPKTGVVTALVSVTGIEDRVKDVIEPGAYTKTMATREPIGVWSHDDKTWVARTESAKELPPGDPFFADIKTMDGKPWPKEAGAVLVEAKFNLDTPHGAAAFSDVDFFKGKTGWSIGYRATKAYRNPRTGVRHIKELDWFEFSPVMVGAASQPLTLSVKSLSGAYAVDPDDATGIAPPEVLESLDAKELAAYDELKASLGLPLEVKDIVRTPAGSKRFGQPIGTEIVKDSIHASALKVGDHIDVHLQKPGGGPSDTVDVQGKVEKVRTSDSGGVFATVDGKEWNLGRGQNPVDVVRAKQPGDTGGRVSPMMKDAVQKAKTEQLDGIIARLKDRKDPDSQATLAFVEAEKAKRAGGGSAPAAPDAGGKAPLKSAAEHAAARFEGRKFGGKIAAERVVKDHGLSDTHEVVPKDGGFTIAKKKPAAPAAPAKPDGDLDALITKYEDQKAKLSRLPSANSARSGVSQQIQDLNRQIAALHVRKRESASKPTPAQGQSLDTMIKESNGNAPGKNQHAELVTKYGLSGGEGPDVRALTAQQQWDYWRGRSGGKSHSAALASSGGDKRAARANEADAAAATAKAASDRAAMKPEKPGYSGNAVATGGTVKVDGRDVHVVSAKEAGHDVRFFLEDTAQQRREQDGSSHHGSWAGLEDHLSTADDVAAGKASPAEMEKLANDLEDEFGSDVQSVADQLRALAKLGSIGGKKADDDDLEVKQLDALNQRRSARGLDELAFLPEQIKALDLAVTPDDVLDAYVDADPSAEFKMAHENLNRSPKQNWVERTGQLPAYIQHIAKDIHEERGMPLSQAIPIAISRCKVWAAGGGGVKPDTRAKAAKAVAEWEALKAKAHAKYDSTLLAQMEQKVAEVLQVEVKDAWEAAGEWDDFGVDPDEVEVKATQVGTAENYLRVDPETGETIAEVSTEPDVAEFEALLEQGAQLKASVDIADLMERREGLVLPFDVKADGQARIVRTEAGARRYGVRVGQAYTEGSQPQEGERGPEIFKAKQSLVRLGLLKDRGRQGVLADSWGGHLTPAIKRFQKEHGLPVTGELDKTTQARLEKEAPSGPAPKVVNPARGDKPAGDPPGGKAPAKAKAPAKITPAQAQHAYSQMDPAMQAMVRREVARIRKDAAARDKPAPVRHASRGLRAV